MAYNRCENDKSSYKHSLAMSYMDLNNEVVIGKEFWKIIGSPGTYDEVLEFYREIGKEKCPDMVQQLL